jgi:hypothetical protein
MPFDDNNWNQLFPVYINGELKDRLKNALVQFRKEANVSEINYDDFYFLQLRDYFMQSDVVKEIRLPFWNGSEFEKTYSDSIVLTNTCDISVENLRGINVKQCLFAPLLEFSTFIADIVDSKEFTEEQVKQHIDNIKKQLISNIFYLPPNHKDGKEYIVLLDNIFWFPTEELHTYLPTINEDKFISLNHFGYYLFMLKLSYHLCRLPETCDRLQQSA